MRELKFRVWDLRRKTFDNYYECELDGPRVEEYFASPPDCLELVLDDLQSDEDFVIQQFCGKLDKNSNKIFEGDIISVNGLLFLCEWKNHGFVFTCLAARGDAFNCYKISLNETSEKMINILGNIFENPGLLESK